MMRKHLSVVFSCIIVSGLAALSGCHWSPRQREGVSTGIKPVTARVADRDFPSVFQAWSRADNLDEDQDTTLARHDLAFLSPEALKLEWNNSYTGLADGFTDESINEAVLFRDDLMEKNPNMVILVEIRYRDAPSRWLPEGHEWWMRNSEEELVYGWKEGGFIRLALDNPAFRNRVAQQASAAVKSGVADGVLLDWWNEEEYSEERLAILREVREAIGPDGLIMVNSNDRKIPLSAPYVNGLFMECYRTMDPSNWEKILSTLKWAEENLREPRVNCLETWFDNSRNDLNKMRATTTLALTVSDGYCLFSDPNSLPAPDHLHDWYPFWEKSLGRPLSDGFLRSDGAWQREFEKGTAIYNPSGNNQIRVVFSKKMKSGGSGKVSDQHVVEPYDGDIFIRIR